MHFSLAKIVLSQAQSKAKIVALVGLEESLLSLDALISSTEVWTFLSSRVNSRVSQVELVGLLTLNVTDKEF